MIDPGTGKQRVRAFCAVPIHKELRELIGKLQKDLAPELPGVRWSRPDNLHLTLRFFGEIEVESLEKAAKVMLSVSALGSPFQLVLNHLGAFPSTARPRVLWLGFEASTAMQQLVERLGKALASAGIPRDLRPFVPHLTLGRARRRLPDVTPLLRRYSQNIQWFMPVEQVVFYQSQLLPQGAVHTPLFERRLEP